MDREQSRPRNRGILGRISQQAGSEDHGTGYRARGDWPIVLVPRST